MTPPNDMPADTELRETLLEILEPHYWNQGFEFDQAKAAAEKSHTYRQLMQLIKARDAAILRDELLNLVPTLSVETECDVCMDNQRIINERIAELSTPTDQKEKV